MSELTFTLASGENEQTTSRLQTVCGLRNANLQLIESTLGVSIANRGKMFKVNGDESNIVQAQLVIEALFVAAENSEITPEMVHLQLRDSGASPVHESVGNDVTIQTKRGMIRGRGTNQRAYLRRIRDNDVNFGIGPAGTGKTYLAVACAVDMLNRDQVRRIILVRPAVEAGERLGFLPGDLTQKVDPYLRPLYDALYDMLGAEKTLKLIEKQVIEVAPLAFMRGRTLSDAFIILDEAQNTTVEQMKMFLTRIGFGSKAVVTGDVSQIDLPKGVRSGLKDATQVLRDVSAISFTRFVAQDVVRHPLVQSIVEAYERKPEDNETNTVNNTSNTHD